MNEHTTHDLVVIGAGVAGLAAAREALRAGLTAAYIEGQMFGGLILNINELDGAIEGSGAEYASNLMSEVADLGGENLEGAAYAIESDENGLMVKSEVGLSRARAVIVATGASLRKLGVQGEAELEAKGVSHCADCDGPMFHGQEVVVVGGGDSALQSALTLAQYCKRVLLMHRNSTLRAHQQLVDKVQASPHIEIHLNCTVSEVLGVEGVEGVKANGKIVPCTGFFAFVGLEPMSSFLPDLIARDARGAVITTSSFETAMPGVYAAGAVRAGCGGMVEDALAEGTAAARAAIARLRESSLT